MRLILCDCSDYKRTILYNHYIIIIIIRINLDWHLAVTDKTHTNKRTSPSSICFLWLLVLILDYFQRFSLKMLPLIQNVVNANPLTSLTMLLLIIGKEIIQGVLWCLSVLLLLLRSQKR